MRKINNEKLVVSLLIILRFVDFHSTLTFMGKYGVYGEFKESNIIFWFLYDILQNHILAIGIGLLITTPIPLLQIYLSKVLNKADRSFYFWIFIIPFILIPLKNYLVCVYHITWIPFFLGITSAVAHTLDTVCFYAVFLFVFIGLYQRRESIKTYLSKNLI